MSIFDYIDKHPFYFVMFNLFWAVTLNQIIGC